MSINLSIIVPHDFKDFRNEGKVREYIENTFDKFRAWFGMQNVSDEVVIDPESGEYFFRLTPLDMTFYLTNGYWCIETYRNYSRYFWRNENNQWWYRNLVFDAVRAMGLKSAFICSEFNSWNSRLDEEICTFEDWVKYSCDETETFASIEDIPVFHAKDMPLYTAESDKRVYYDYRQKYLDNFEESIDKLASLEALHPECEILMTTQIGHFLLVKINGKTTLINSKTGTPLLDDAIDGVDNTLNCAGIVIRKEGKAALFSNSGKQLTNFREGDFAWKWADIGNHCPLGYLFREIIDKASGQSWIEPE